MIRSDDELGDGCHILAWNYNVLSEMSFDEALIYTGNQLTPKAIACSQYLGAYQTYTQEEGVSIVPEV